MSERKEAARKEAEPEMWYCDGKKRITEAEFMKLHWKKMGCAHQIDQVCECDCHKEAQAKKEAGYVMLEEDEDEPPEKDEPLEDDLEYLDEDAYDHDEAEDEEG